MTRGPSPEPLPAELGVPFTLAEARARGLTRSRLRAVDLDGRIRGVRALAGASDDLETRCRMLAMRLPPEAFFSHTTAALLLGAPLPYALERDEPVHVTVESPRRAPHGKDLAGHSRFIAPGDVRVFHGIRHSSPERAWLEVASRLALTDLVAVGDHLIHHRAPRTSPARLGERIAVGDPIARRRQLTPALGLLDDRAESRPESIVRVILALSDLPNPLVNQRVVVTTEGAGIRTDFVYPARKFVIEYQGDYHRARAQWRADMTRRSRLEADGWQVMELNYDDLKNPTELVARIRRSLSRRP